MSAEKISISLDERQIAFLSRYQRAHAVRSRSEVVASALQLLEEAETRASYRSMLAELQASGDLELWDQAAADGLGSESELEWWR